MSYDKLVFELSSPGRVGFSLPESDVPDRPLPVEFIQHFNDANSIGLNNIPAVVAENSSPDFDLTTYYTQSISYRLTPSKRQGMQKFLSYLQ